ncbi:MAG: hypothetical protein ABI678_20595 [Kofleriaceae bacterium]
MVRLALLLAALAACDKHADAPAAPSKVPVLPDLIESQLGTIGFAMAVDLHALDLAKVATMLPDDPPCLRQVLSAAQIGAVTQGGETWEGYVSGVTEPTLRACVEKFAPMMGVSVQDHGGGGFELVLPGKPAVFQWRGELALITQGSDAPHAGEPPAVILDLLTRVPRSAKGWVVSSGFPNYKIKISVAWLETDPTYWTFTILAEGTEMDAAKPWLQSVIDGFKAGAAQKGVTIDDKWFTLESTPPTGKLVAKVPIAAFAGP